jgi:hypothetical protein
MKSTVRNVLLISSLTVVATWVWTYTASLDHNLPDSIAARLNVLFHAKTSTTYDLGMVFLF